MSTILFLDTRSADKTAGRMSLEDLQCPSSSYRIITTNTKQKLLPRARLLLMHFEDVDALLFVVRKLHVAGEQSPAVFLRVQFWGQSFLMYLSMTGMRELNVPLARSLMIPSCNKRWCGLNLSPGCSFRPHTLRRM